MANLTTNYLGLKINNPLIASASALSKKLDNIKQMEDAGLGAVVMYSLFEEAITHESKALNHYLVRNEDSFWEAVTFYPDLGNYNMGPERYLKGIQDAKASVDIPIIGSLNGVSTGGWIRYAKLIEEAGADALELNLYFLPADTDFDAATIESAQIKLVKDIQKSIGIPLSVKLSPFYSSLPGFAASLSETGIKSMVLFNRFYQPDFDIEKLEVIPKLNLSTSADILLPMRWTAILYDRIKPQIALSSGVHTGEDIAKAVLAGATAVMTASELISNGISKAKELIKVFSDWVDEHGYKSIEQMRGAMSQKNVENPSAFERANYMKALTLFDNRILYIK